MKKLKRLCSVLILLSILATAVLTLPLSADDMGSVDAQYKQKVVAVIYDDSGSMLDKKDIVRNPSAKYALGTLISLMDERDTMAIIPMNGIDPTTLPNWEKDWNSVEELVFSSTNSSRLDVDLANANGNKDRNGLVKDIIENKVLTPVSYKNTPSASLTRSVEFLKEEGLQNSANLSLMDPNKEYWLIILTDGQFNYDLNGNRVENSDITMQQQIDYLAAALGDYPTLNTVYVSFGSAAWDLSSGIKNDPTLKNLPITSYCGIQPKTADGDDLISVIQKISNDVSERYALENTADKTYYSIEGNTLTVDLSQLPFSLASLSVVAQDCGGNEQATTYTGAAQQLGDTNITIKNKCTIAVDPVLGLKSGCSFEIVPDSYLKDGKLMIEFSDGSDLSNVSILAKPAMQISYYFEMFDGTEWIRTGLDAIEKNCVIGDKVCVGYEVTDPVTGDPLDLDSIFGDVEAIVEYVTKGTGNTLEKITSKMGSTPRSVDEKNAGEVFELIKGSNPLSVQIKMMDGAYTLRDTRTINIKDKIEIVPSEDIAVTGASPMALGSFRVKINNVFADSKILEAYGCDITVSRGASGMILETYNATPDSKGELSASYEIETNEFDTYVFTLTLTDEDGQSYTGSCRTTYAPNDVDLSVSPDTLTKTQHDLTINEDGFEFWLSSNGNGFPFANGLTEYKLTVDGTDVSEYVKISGDKLIYIPTDESLGDIVNSPGEKKVVLTLESASHPGLNETEEATLIIEKTTYAVAALTTPNKTIDRFDLQNCDATLAFAVLRDGKPMPADELALMKDQILIETSPFFRFFLFPAGMEWDIEEYDGAGAIVVRAVKDMPRFFEWHFSAFITGSDKPITVSYPEAAPATDAFEMKDSSILVHILRIFCLILLIAIITYIVIYIVGFFVAKPLPSGVFIVISNGGFETLSYVNESVFKVIKWHLKRFISPPKLLKNQSIHEQAPWCEGLIFEYTDDGRLVVTPEEENTIYRLRVSPSPNTTNAIRRYLTAIAAGQAGPFNEYLSKPPVDPKKLFRSDVVALPTTTKVGVSGSYVGKCSKNGYVYAVTFKPLNRNL